MVGHLELTYPALAERVPFKIVDSFQGLEVTKKAVSMTCKHDKRARCCTSLVTSTSRELW